MIDESQVVYPGAHCTPLRAQWCNGLPILQIRCTKGAIGIYPLHREEKSLKNSRQSLLRLRGKRDSHEKCSHFFHGSPGSVHEATKGKNTCSFSLTCFVLPTNALTPILFSRRALSRFCKRAMAFPLFPQPLRWVDTYGRLAGTSIYAAWATMPFPP
ncbi:hypothetical protein HMPREF9080_00503 [Cardiobacterium valvarum F0432]|uniref:Uncharacterized protein n=1 Tax=Cardiobacterium valvarum F0432 TaxID=797473 RepID=G9ZCM5_9GAMM|nr:hypothetical protein HMPREF9080_00503 [Cardiobacterium valvarum F0432]